MSFDLISMWQQSGFIAKGVIVILLLCSIWTFKVAVEKFLAYNASRKQSTEYLPHLVNCLKQGKIQEAIDASKKFNKAHIAKVVSSGLLEYQSTKDQGELVMLDSTRRALEMAMAVTSAELRKGLGALGNDRHHLPLHRPVRDGVRHHQRLPGHRHRRLGRPRAPCPPVSPRRSSPRRVGLGVAIPAVVALQLLHRAARALPGRDDQLLLRADRLHREAPWARRVTGKPASALRSRRAPSSRTSTSRRSSTWCWCC